MQTKLTELREEFIPPAAARSQRASPLRSPLIRGESMSPPARSSG